MQIKTSMVFSLVFAKNTILSYFFFFLIIDLYFLIQELLAKISTPTEKFKIFIGILTKEAKSEIETHPVTTETKISKCSVRS